MIFILLQSFTEKKMFYPRAGVNKQNLKQQLYPWFSFVTCQAFMLLCSCFFSLCLFVFRFFCDRYNTMKQCQREKCFKYISHHRRAKKNLGQLPIGNRCGSMKPGLSQTFYFDSAQFEIENTKHICFVLIEAEYKSYSKNRKENLEEAN